MEEEELFHILHKAVYLINEEREEKDKFIILDKELYKVTEQILKEDILGGIYD